MYNKGIKNGVYNVTQLITNENIGVRY